MKVRATGKKSYKLSIDVSSMADLEGPLRIEVEYVGPNGKSIKSAIGPGSVEVLLAAGGWQEPRIRVGSGTINGQVLRVMAY